MPTTCAIEFDNPSKVYYSGQNFNGRIVLRLTKEITVRGSTLYFIVVDVVVATY